MISHNQTKNKNYDIHSIRAQFPCLESKINGNPLCYLDNAASAQKPHAVLKRLQEFYSYQYANVHRGIHELSVKATHAYEDARKKVQQFIGAQHAHEMIFTTNATAAINMIAASYGKLHFQAGDEIIISLMEHHSNIVPWHFWRERSGVNIKWVPLDHEGNLCMQSYEDAFSDKTKFVSISHMSNVLGTCNPVKDIVDIAHKNGVAVLLDGSQAAVHTPINVQEIDCDFYVCTGHKLYGPTGIGVCYAKEKHLQDMPPFMGGGEMIESVGLDSVVYGGLPQKFEAGTPQIAQAVGLGEALDFINSIGMENISQHEAELLQYATDKLLEIKGLRIIGTAKEKGAIITFALKDIHAHDVSAVLDKYGVAVRAGKHCCDPLHEYFNVQSTCRASFGLYNSIEDVEQLHKALIKVKEFF